MSVRTKTATLFVFILVCLTARAVSAASYSNEKWRLPFPDWTTGARMYVTTGYGQGEHTGCLNYWALDFASGDYPSSNWPIVAAANGTITTEDYNSEAGNYIDITHDDGSGSSHYAHMNSWAFGLGA